MSQNESFECHELNAFPERHKTSHLNVTNSMCYLNVTKRNARKHMHTIADFPFFFEGTESLQCHELNALSKYHQMQRVTEAQIHAH